MLSVSIAGSEGGVPRCRRAAVEGEVQSGSSNALNIAEGYGRYHYPDSLCFYYIARGSLEETLSGFVICDEVGYTAGKLPDQRELCHSALRTLNGYIRYVKGQRRGSQEYGDQLVQEESPTYVILPELLED